jgi:SAM-dependent methyltransferase
VVPTVSPGPADEAQRRERRVANYARFAPFYDRLVGDALYPAIRNSFEWVRRRLALRFDSVADIGCGTGRFLAHLVRYRARLIGVDAAAAVLKVAAQRLDGADVLWLHQDFRHLQLPYPVDLITCNGDTLNYLLRRDELAVTLRRCAAQLTPGGYLIGDFLSGTPTPLALPARTRCIRLPGLISCWDWQALPAQRLTRVGIRFANTDGSKPGPAQEVHWQRWYGWRELRDLLVQSGLTGCQVWAMPSSGGAGPRGRWLKFAARRAMHRY